MIAPSIQELHRALGGEISNNQIRCPGPGHSAKDRSLSVKLAPDAADGFTVYSFAADDPLKCKDYVRSKLGMPAFRPGNGKDQAKRIVAQYDYRSATGELLFQVVRFEPKDFRQRRPDGNGGWSWNLQGVTRTLYRLPEITEALSLGKPVFVVEGEKDVDALWKLSIPATCNSGGAGKWRDEYSRHFRGATVYVIPDNDQPGRDHAQQVAKSLTSAGATVRNVDLPGPSKPGADASNWLEAGGTAEQLYALADSAPVWTAPQAQATVTALLQSSAQFIAHFVPPDYVMDGILQRRFFYCLTGKTGAGKTAILLLIAAHVAVGLPIGRIWVQKGRVVYFAGENADDVRMRWIALAQQMGFDPNTIDVHFIDKRVKLSEVANQIKDEVKAIGDVTLVIIDTAPAYFEGDDFNNNAQQLAHAVRLRELTTLTGGPAVVAATHPVKNAGDDNLIPYGGGALLNEMDGNLTARSDGTASHLHWQGKFRGPDFAPTTFQLRTVTHAELKDSKGRLMPTVIAGYLSEASQEELAAVARTNEDKLLEALRDNKGASLAVLAKGCGWYMKDGEPHKVKVERTLKALKGAGLVIFERGKPVLTEKGKGAIKS
jgi:hypothetical protein